MNIKRKSLLSVSILIPTLNAGRVLEKCLLSIAEQDYPKKKIGIIVADGGSTDETLKIAKRYGAKIYKNPLKTGEAGKAVALRQAQGKLVALIDSDNILPSKNWLRRMVEPFSDPEIIGSEPWEFTYRKTDSLVNRYCALIGANDPYCYFVGNYDKKSVLSGKWTGMEVRSAKHEVRNEEMKKAKKKTGDYLKIQIEWPNIPTIGANGTIWRRQIFKKAAGKSKYVFDTDIPYILARRKPFCFAKVKVGIVHDYCRSVKDFYRKQKRRARDFFYLENKKEREKTYQRQLIKQLYFIFSVVLVFPLIFQMIKGYIKKPDKAWLFHPLACLMTLWLYSSETILAWFRQTEMSREGWRQ